MFANYLGQNYICLFAIVGLAILLRFNVSLEKHYVTKLSRFLLFCIFLTFVEIVEIFVQEYNLPPFLLKLTTAVGLATYPFVIIFLGFMAFSFKPVQKLYVSIPAIANGVIMLVSIFVPIVFSVSEDLEYQQGVLSALPHIIPAAYVIFFVVITVLYYFKHRHTNILILLVIFLAIGGAVLLKLVSSSTRAFMGASVLAVLLFYIYLLTLKYRLDPLTNCLNRNIMYLDVRSFFNDITAAIMIDLNGLKELNDTKGHIEGDKALKAIVDCCNKNTSPTDKLYRLGGDEFVILCYKKDRDAVTPLAEKIVEDLKSTPYSAAFGIAFRENGDTFDGLMHKADIEMYSDKQRHKQSLKETNE